MDQNPPAQLSPSSIEDAQQRLDQIADQITQLQSQYNQLQLQAAWLQGWIANQTVQSRPAADSVAAKKKTKK